MQRYRSASSSQTPLSNDLCNPVTGQCLNVLSPAGLDDCLVMEASYPPGGAVPPDHLHPHQQEHFTVIAGSLQVRLDGWEHTLGPGEVLEVPAGAAHTMWNAGGETAHVRWETWPAGRTEEFHRVLFGLARDGYTGPDGVPGLLHLSLLVPEYADVVRLARPPEVVQRLVFGALAPVARRLGYTLAGRVSPRAATP